MNQSYCIAHQYILGGQMNIINELQHILLGVDPLSANPLAVLHLQVCGGPAFATVNTTEQLVHPN